MGINKNIWDNCFILRRNNLKKMKWLRCVFVCVMSVCFFVYYVFFELMCVRICLIIFKIWIMGER